MNYLVLESSRSINIRYLSWKSSKDQNNHLIPRNKPAGGMFADVLLCVLANTGEVYISGRLRSLLLISLFCLVYHETHVMKSTLTRILVYIYRCSLVFSFRSNIVSVNFSTALTFSL
jgi:hypothetical protein